MIASYFPPNNGDHALYTGRTYLDPLHNLASGVEMATYLWGTPVDVEIRLDAEEARRQYEVKLEKERRETLAVYLDGESVVGQVCGTLTSRAQELFNVNGTACFLRLQ
jgi:Vacuolar protein sorting-associated protein 26